MIGLHNNKLGAKAISAAALVLALSLGCCSASAQDAPQRIDKLSVKVNFRTPVPAPVRERIVSSVESVGTKALQGKSLDEAVAMQASLAQVMKKIFTEVLSGFQVKDLSIELGPPAEIRLDLDVEQPQIESVRFDVEPQAGLHPYWTQYFAGHLSAAETDLEKSLKGIPVGSARWSADIVAQMVRERLSTEPCLTGFEFESSVEMATETVIKIAIKPAGQTVRSVSVKVRSTTMPSILLERLKFDMTVQAETLVGLPADFAKSHEQDIIKSFFDYLKDNSQVERLGLNIDIRPVFIRRSIIITVIAESRKYSGFLRGKVGIGQETRNPDIEGHLGIFARSGTELFTETNFFPGPIKFQFNLGAGQRLGPKLYAAVGRNVVDGLNRVWVDYYVSEDIIISWKKNVVAEKDQSQEGCITFKAHDFFSFDLVTDFHRNVWVRFVTNL